VKVEQPIKPAEPQKPINKEHKKELQKQQRIFEQLEEKLAALNKQRAILEASLSTPEIYGDKEKFRKAEADYKKVSEECVQLNKEYEKVFEKIMELEAKG
jgi:ATP-binding cassette subfamily F protein 3